MVSHIMKVTQQFSYLVLKHVDLEPDQNTGSSQMWLVIVAMSLGLGLSIPHASSYCLDVELFCLPNNP